MRKRFVYLAVSKAVRLLVPVRRRCSLESVRNILVIGTGGVGDIVMKTPVFDHLKRAFPKAKIVFFTSSGPERSIIEGHPGIDEIITLGGREALTVRHPRQVLAYLRKLRSRQFDMTLTTHQGIRFRGALMTYLIGAPIRVGFDKGGRGDLYTVRVEVADADARHAVDWNLDLISALGIEVGKRELSLPLAAEDRQFASDFFAARGVDDLVVALFQGSKRVTRLWPDERFAAVGDALARRYHARILLLGGERERATIEHTASLMEEKPIVAIGQSITQTAALIARSGLLVSTDSGPMHIAAAVGTPVVALFGPETPTRVRPYSVKSAVVRHAVPCSPCHDYGCRLGTIECMMRITPEDVLETIQANAVAWGLTFRR